MLAYPQHCVEVSGELCALAASQFRYLILTFFSLNARTAVAEWLRCCATNRKVAGSIAAGVIEFFIHIISFRSHYGPGVDTASNRNEYQEHFLGVKTVSAYG